MNPELLMLVERIKVHKETLRTEYSSNEYIEIRFEDSTECFEVTIDGVDVLDQPEHSVYRYSEINFTQFLINNSDKFGAWRWQ